MDNITIDSKPEPKYKDRLFRMIFGQNNKQSAKWRLELYNALSEKHHTNPDDLQLTTIENAIYITMKNDISFLVDSQMTLYEHQSTFNKNMPLRGLLYFSQLYQMYLSKEGKDLFGAQVKIPSPRYIVFYNGDRKLPEKSELRLSDSFIDFNGKGDFEWTATVLNINKDYNKTIQKTCKPLYDYIRYVDRIKVNQKSGMSIKEAVDKAVDYAISENFLEGFFKEQRAEVTAMSLTEFDQENYDKNRRREGFEEGEHSKTIEVAKNLIKMKLGTYEQIAQAEGITVEEVKRIAEEINNS